MAARSDHRLLTWTRPRICLRRYSGGRRGAAVRRGLQDRSRRAGPSGLAPRGRFATLGPPAIPVAGGDAPI